MGMIFLIFDKKLELIQKKMENTNKKNEELLKNKTQEFKQELKQKIKIIEAYKNENKRKSKIYFTNK